MNLSTKMSKSSRNLQKTETSSVVKAWIFRTVFANLYAPAVFQYLFNPCSKFNSDCLNIEQCYCSYIQHIDSWMTKNKLELQFYIDLSSN